MSASRDSLNDIRRRIQGLREEIEKKDDIIDKQEKKLKEYEEKERVNETELAGYCRRVTLLEEELDSTTTRLQTAQDMLDEASKAADESERARKVLENKNHVDDERCSELEKLAKSYHQQASEWEVKYDEVARKNVSLEMNLSTKEDQCEDREKKLQDLESQLQTLASSLRSCQVAMEKSAEKEDYYEGEIDRNRKLIDELASKNDELENGYKNAMRQINELEGESETWKAKYYKAEEEYESAMGTLSGL